MKAVYFAPLLILLFPAFWLFVTGLLAQMSGWVMFAQRFPAQQAEAGETFRFASGGMGSRSMPVRYGGCLFVTVNERGFHLSLFVLFRFRSPPMFVPWTAVQTVTQATVFMTRRTLLELKGFEQVMIFRGAAADAIEKHFRQFTQTHPANPFS